MIYVFHVHINVLFFFVFFGVFLKLRQLSN